jgi:PKD repeat protein
MRLLLLALLVGALVAPQAALANAPIACFTQSPAGPYVTGIEIAFDSSCSHSPGGRITARGWEFDNTNQFNDGGGITAKRTYTSPGTYTVKLGVVNDEGEYAIASKQIVVAANRLPTASFTFTPAAPLTNESVTFTSTSTDPDGPIKSQSWDLDGNGFNDGTTASVSRAFAAPGTYTVRLRVVDGSGAEDISSRTVTVSNRSPTAAFSFTPAAPASGQAVTFTSSSSDPDGTIASQSWDLNGDGFNDGTAAVLTHSFARPGTFTIRLRVVDNRGAENITSRTITVANRAPAAAFGISPVAPLTKQPVTFTSTSSDPDGTIASQSWDFDGNGFNDGTAASVSHAFDTPGTYTIRLRVLDDHGAENITSGTVTVGNRPPIASFVHSPDTLLAGNPITLTSTAEDGDGTVVSQAWDLDGDGKFDDATGPTASLTPPSAGLYPVGLRVVDDRGTAALSTQTLVVAARPIGQTQAPTGQTLLPELRTTDAAAFDSTGPIVVPEPDPVSPVATLRWLDPFPVVRIRGVTTPRGARLTLLSVTAPDGALAELRCTGEGCPAKVLRKTIRTRGGNATASVRFSRMERFLPAGTQFQVAVTREGLVGKYTRFTIRRLTLPARTDRCVLPGSGRPVACPVSR